MADKDEIATLRAKIERLEAKIAPTPHDPAEEGKWRDAMHQGRERRASAAARLAFSPDQLAAMRAAAPDNVIKDIVRDNRAPQSPSSPGGVPSTQQVSNRVGVPGGGTGWAHEVPIGPPPGIGFVDALCELDSARQRGERRVEEAKRRVPDEEKPK